MALPLVTVGNSQAQDIFPNRPVRIVVGFAPGTGPDIIARLVANQLSQQWPEATAVVQNSAGAASLIAAQEVVRAAPDGYTLLLGATALLSIAPSTYSKLPFDPDRDFVPVSNLAESDFVLLVNPDKVPARTPGEFLTWAKAQKDPIFMGTFGAGTIGHFGAYILGDAIDLKPEMVHYRTTVDAIGGLYRGDVQGAFATVGLAVSQTSNGKLIALACSGPSRSTKLPNVPTFKEAGYPGIGFTTWFGIVAPAGTPPAVIAQLRKAIQTATRIAGASIEQAGFRPVGSTEEEFARTMEVDKRMWAKVVRATGFKAD